MQAIDKQSDRISPHDEADLSWFFGPGAACFEKSTFGMALDRAVQFGQAAEPCASCAGLGFVELTAEQMVERAKRYEALSAERKDDDATAATRSDEEVTRLREKRDAQQRALGAESDCPDCNAGRGEVKRIKVRVGDAFSATARCTLCKGRKTLNGKACDLCLGEGYFVPVTVNSSAPKTDEEGWCPDDEALIRYARVSKRLDRLSEGAFEALQLFYGDRGCRWASTIQGRLLALYALTPAGGKLAARGITQQMRETMGELGLRLDEAIANECEAQRMTPTETRKKQLASAREQAARLLEAASVEWLATGLARTVGEVTHPSEGCKVDERTNVTVTASLETSPVEAIQAVA